MTDQAPPILLVMQANDASAGRCARKLQERGYPLHYCYPQAGEALPTTLTDYAGVMVFGGPMSVNDDDKLPAIRAQLDWIPQVLATNQPFLGVCLGAQLLARALGARVEPHPAGLAEIGYFPVQPTSAGQALFPTSLWVYHWHCEGFELPAGAELLASGGSFPHQAYRYGANAFGVQFHPEVDQAILEHWLTEGANQLAISGAQPAATQRLGHARYDAALDRWVDHFLDQWLSKYCCKNSSNGS